MLEWLTRTYWSSLLRDLCWFFAAGRASCVRCWRVDFSREMFSESFASISSKQDLGSFPLSKRVSSNSTPMMIYAYDHKNIVRSVLIQTARAFESLTAKLLPYASNPYHSQLCKSDQRKKSTLGSFMWNFIVYFRERLVNWCRWGELAFSRAQTRRQSVEINYVEHWKKEGVTSRASNGVIIVDSVYKFNIIILLFHGIRVYSLSGSSLA